MKITNEFRNLPLERKEEIRDIAINMSAAACSYYFETKYQFDLIQKLNKAYFFFQKYYKSTLNDAEKSVFYLYVIFPNDEYFMDLIERYEKDFQKIASIYQVTDAIVRFRYVLQRNIKLERDLEEAKTKKKAMN